MTIEAIRESHQHASDVGARILFEMHEVKTLLDAVDELTSLLREGVDNGCFDDESTCPYFAGTGNKQCDRGCWEEPICHTNHPREGWLGERVRALFSNGEEP